MNLTDEFTFLRVWFHVGIHEVSGFQSPEGGLGANGDTIVELSEGGLGTNGKHECVERQHGMTPKGPE